MATKIIRIADGRLLVQESRACESRYVGSGIPVRVGHIKTVERVISVTTDYERYGLMTPLQEVTIGGPNAWVSGTLAEREDHILVVMRRGDAEGMGVVSGLLVISGGPALGLMSGLTSGLVWQGELASGLIAVSGVVTVTANVIGF